ncbi:MAG: stage 0 sporulation family protein [Nitrospirota bacterium]|nr:stage 0 sporulation family protein [Nitrospirota bacterium]
MTALQELQEPYPETVRIAGIKVRGHGDVKKMGVGDAFLRVGDRVILEVDREPTYGVVYTEPLPMPFSPPMRVMRSIVRPATEADQAQIARHERMCQEGMSFCRERAKALGLDLKMVEVYASFTRREITFVYTSEDRIDFRQLVRDLARRFGGRIEMRHIGAREEAKRIGGVDSCGLTLCCSAFMTDFRPVSVKKARGYGQDISMNENRLIGICGRLKCCLMFEEMEARASAAGQPPRPQALITPERPTGPIRPS